MEKKVHAAIGLKSFYSFVEGGGRAWRTALQNGTSGGTVGSDGHLLPASSKRTGERMSATSES